MPDAFESLAVPHEPRLPRPEFTRDLRSRLVAALDLPVQLPGRNTPMATPLSTTATTTVSRATSLVPYLCVADGATALAWYTDVFGATETMRVVGDDDRIGHAELQIGDVTIYVSDEYPDYGIAAPGGPAPVTLYLTVGSVDDVFARAVTAGATVQSPLGDQPDGDRRGTLVDPFGHRWMIAQPIDRPAPGEYAERIAGSGYTVTSHTTAEAGAQTGEIWATLAYDDARSGIAFLTDVLGFEARLVVVDDDDPDRVTHAEFVWPEGGVVDVGSTGREPHVDRVQGRQALYIVTSDPGAVWERCQAAGAVVVRQPEEPPYAPGTMGFGVADPEGNVFWFGQYAGEAT